MEKCTYYDIYCCLQGHCGYQIYQENANGEEYIFCGIEDEFERDC